MVYSQLQTFFAKHSYLSACKGAQLYLPCDLYTSCGLSETSLSKYICIESLLLKLTSVMLLVQVANYMVRDLSKGCMTCELLQPDELVSGLIAQVTYSSFIYQNDLKMR